MAAALAAIATTLSAVGWIAAAFAVCAATLSAVGGSAAAFADWAATLDDMSAETLTAGAAGGVQKLFGLKCFKIICAYDPLNLTEIVDVPAWACS